MMGRKRVYLEFTILLCINSSIVGYSSYTKLYDYRVLIKGRRVHFYLPILELWGFSNPVKILERDFRSKSK